MPNSNQTSSRSAGPRPRAEGFAPPSAKPQPNFDIAPCFSEAEFSDAVADSDRLAAWGDFSGAAAHLETLDHLASRRLETSQRYKALLRRAWYLRNAGRWSEARSCQLIAQRLRDTTIATASETPSTLDSHDSFELFYGHACDAIQAGEQDTASRLLTQLEHLTAQDTLARQAAIEVGWARLFATVNRHRLAVFRLAKALRTRSRLEDFAGMREILEQMQQQMIHLTQHQTTARAMMTLRELMERLPLEYESPNSGCDDVTRILKTAQFSQAFRWN